jgi:hypothetical protein
MRDGCLEILKDSVIICNFQQSLQNTLIKATPTPNQYRNYEEN